MATFAYYIILYPILWDRDSDFFQKKRNLVFLFLPIYNKKKRQERKSEMKHFIRNFIQQYIAQTQKERPRTADFWREPLVGFADAWHPDIQNLPDVVHPQHVLPQEILPHPTIIIAYFLPFQKNLIQTNIAGTFASPEWAEAYEETNALFYRLNHAIIEVLQKQGIEANISPEASVFDEKVLKSKWSQRHIARVAGLGTFGLNNMLITAAGCCGRLSTVVTNLRVTADTPLLTENCLYKKSGRCGLCVKRCPSGALKFAGYDRKICFELCEENAAIHNTYGNSYTAVPGGEVAASGSQVCGKCLVGLPCSFQKPA